MGYAPFATPIYEFLRVIRFHGAGSQQVSSRFWLVLKRFSPAAMRKPFNVMSGSTWSMRSTPLRLLSRSSRSNHEPDARPAHLPAGPDHQPPVTVHAPDCMASTVLVPMTRDGSRGQ